jgi:hypothetical protein
MRRFIRYFVTFVGFDAFILLMPLCQEQTDGAFGELREVFVDPSRFLMNFPPASKAWPQTNKLRLRVPEEAKPSMKRAT